MATGELKSSAVKIGKGQLVHVGVPDGSGCNAVEVESTPDKHLVALLSECNSLQFGRRQWMSFAIVRIVSIEVDLPCAIGCKLSSTGFVGSALCGIVVEISKGDDEGVLQHGKGTMSSSH